jgi:hypothetical protein
MTSTAKDFNKGDLVTLITRWSAKGVFTVRNAVVAACGPKQMHLIDAETGEEMGHNYRPSHQQPSGVCLFTTTDDAALTMALEMSAMWKATELLRMHNAIDRYPGDVGYERAMRKQIAELEACEPSSMKYAEAAALIRSSLDRKG